MPFVLCNNGHNYSDCIHACNRCKGFIEIFLYRQEKGRQYLLVNSLQKKKIRREMRMNVQIDEYDLDSIIMDLVSNVNILTKRILEMMGKWEKP